ncbi:MAG: hypothetical protein AAF438_10345 [Pseudomonadota bacterium]
MFLRRLSTDLRNQNWLAVGIELLVVAVGIFLGLQASNWNDDRVERTLEHGYLIRLHEDILESARGLERDNEFLEEQLSDQAIVLAALDACEFSPDDELAIQRGIGSLGWLNPPRLFRRTIDDLAASGRTNIIRSTQIKAELAGLVADVEFRDRVTESIFRMVEHHRSVLDKQVRYDVSKPLGGSPWAVAVNFDIQTLCDEPRNASAVSVISFQTRERLIAYQALLNRYQSFLPLIENELQSRWNDTIGEE